MNDTPRTDAIAHAGFNADTFICRMTAHARELERELAKEHVEHLTTANEYDLLKVEKDRLSGIADKLLAHMDDGTHEAGGECSVCARICCPHGEPLHFHHDGCPACHEP